MSELFVLDEKSEDSVKKSFSEIADKLINNYCLKIGEITYEFLDFEFYYYCTTHNDTYTKKDSKINKYEKGILFAHDYGIDISLYKDDNSYGGILLRGLKRNDNNRQMIIKKPEIMISIFNDMNKTNEKIRYIEKSVKDSFEILSTVRKNLGNKHIKEYYDGKYRYIIIDKEYWKNLEGKEKILKKDSELSNDQINDLLGYNLYR